MSINSISTGISHNAGKICRRTFIVSLKRRPLAQNTVGLSCRSLRQDKPRCKPGIVAYRNQFTVKEAVPEPTEITFR